MIIYEILTSNSIIVFSLRIQKECFGWEQLEFIISFAAFSEHSLLFCSQPIILDKNQPIVF